MTKHYVVKKRSSLTEGNIYADKSSLVLHWLLEKGVNRDDFSIRDVARASHVSIGLVQRVFKNLIFHGLMESSGIRTAKKFFLKNPSMLLEAWSTNYNISKKCRLLTYQTSFTSREEMINALKSANLDNHVCLALHSAANAYGYKNTNLETLEIYLNDPAALLKTEKTLLLEPQDSGYSVLIVLPYYKSLTRNEAISSPILTYLDLFHFPLRGQEQADFFAKRNPTLRAILHKR